MKKLSEIGTHYNGGDTTHAEGTFLTPTERRELVKAAINGWESFKWHRGFADGKLPTFEEFCEEHGL
jgi:hypothetical protein